MTLWIIIVKTKTIFMFFIYVIFEFFIFLITAKKANDKKAKETMPYQAS